jgi:formylmethanofuran dehydrogenase subunit C
MDDLTAVGRLQLTPEKLDLFIREASFERFSNDVKAVDVLDTKSADWGGCGWRYPIPITFHGSIGDFCLSGATELDATIHGDVGSNFCSMLTSGTAKASGCAGNATAAFARGGLVVIGSNSGDRSGVGLSGGDLMVLGSVGEQAGFQMQSGNLIIAGDTGSLLGLGATGGTIYVRGKPASVASNIEEDRMREADRLRLSLLLLKSGIDLKSAVWKVFRVAPQ